MLNYSQITDVFYGKKTKLIEKPKSIIGRTLVGGVLFGGTGAVVGAISGNGKKIKKETHLYFIIRNAICNLKTQECLKVQSYLTS